MGRARWEVGALRQAVEQATSVRQTLQILGLKPAGGNYAQLRKYLAKYQISTQHFTGHAWNRGKVLPYRPTLPLADVLVLNSTYQSSKLKRRLFRLGLRKQECELCGWAKKSADGRLPLELDHINGDSSDNRIENLRILCPNCHSLQPTHRGRNIGKVKK